MLIKQIILILFIALSIGCNHRPPPSEDGQDWHIFLNTSEFMLHELKQYAPLPIRFIDIKQGKFNDSNYVSGVDVDWKFYIQPFLDVNLYDSANQGLYKYDQIIDTITNTATLTYLPLYSGLPLQRMIVSLDMTTGDVQSIFAESINNGLWTRSNTKILYQKGSVIQIIENKQSRIGKATRNIKKLVFKLPPMSNTKSVLLQQ